MIIRSKAPLRLGIAGGGTDVPPYSEMYGGAILNATINLYAYATIVPRNDNKIVLQSYDKSEFFEFKSKEFLEIDGNLNLLKGIYNRVVKDFTKKKLSFTLSTRVDAPPGSGLGTSSTLVVAILGAFAEWLNIPFGEYDLANLAYKIEREDLKMAGGKQDQYAATFGGVNFMEFYKDNKVIVNPLRIKSKYLNELAYNLVLYYTGTSRLSSDIIKMQSNNIQNNVKKSIDAMHKLKKQALKTKETLLKGQIDKIGDLLNYGWEAKKNLASNISNKDINNIYNLVRKAGASGGKISGAGGGGFMFFYCPNNSRENVIKQLEKLDGEVKRYDFTTEGLKTWTMR